MALLHLMCLHLLHLPFLSLSFQEISPPNVFCFREKGFWCLTGVLPWTKEKPVVPTGSLGLLSPVA